jgi:hypothetical protein
MPHKQLQTFRSRPLSLGGDIRTNPYSLVPTLSVIHGLKALLWPASLTQLPTNSTNDLTAKLPLLATNLLAFRATEPSSSETAAATLKAEILNMSEKSVRSAAIRSRSTSPPAPSKSMPPKQWVISPAGHSQPSTPSHPKSLTFNSGSTRSQATIRKR